MSAASKLPVNSRYVFTLNNYKDDDLTMVADFAAAHCKYLICGKEVGASGTPHLQGFFILSKRNRMTWLVKKLPRASFQESKGSNEQASEYCKKEGDYVEYGEFQAQGKRNDLDQACAMIQAGNSLKRVAEEHPTVCVKFSRGLGFLQALTRTSYEAPSVRGIWLFGPPGAGKSHLVRDVFPSVFIKAQNKWFDGYDNEPVILIDDFDKGGKCLGHYMKIWADKWSCSGEIKGATTSLNHRWFVITSNYEPSEIFDDDPVMLQAIERRFAIRACWAHSREEDKEWLSALVQE